MSIVFVAQKIGIYNELDDRRFIMKKFKQIFSLILAILMLITAVPMQSFAAFDFLYPAVKSIEYAGEPHPISYKGVLSDRWSEDDEYVSLLGK